MQIAFDIFGENMKERFFSGDIREGKYTTVLCISKYRPVFYTVSDFLSAHDN